MVGPCAGQFGYPQPEDGFGYREATYDLSNYCPTCGMGAVQRAPFRMRSEPKQSRSQFLQLNWVFDEIFVRDVVIEVLAKGDVASVKSLRPVVHKTGRPVQSVSQLQIDHILPPALLTEGLQTVTCTKKRGVPQRLSLRTRIRISQESLLQSREVSRRRARANPFTLGRVCGRTRFRKNARVLRVWFLRISADSNLREGSAT